MRPRNLLTRPRGFTLIELMIVVAIVAILATIALPSYRQYVLRGNRAAAKAALADIVARQEAFYADRKTYTASLTDLNYAANPRTIGADGQDATGSGVTYSLSLTGTSATAFIAQAAPQNGQAQDTKCGTLTINNLGVKGISGGTSDAKTCWGK